MQAATTVAPERARTVGELESVEFSVGDDDTARARLAMPLSAESGSPYTLVYLEVDPGNRIPPHTHTADEVFVVLEGSGIVTAGEEQWQAEAGAIAVAPAFVSHSWENTGSTALKVVGFLPANVLIHEFEAPVAPFGAARFVTPV